MFEAAGLSTDKKITGHSGKVTCCTELSRHGFAPEDIKRRSGHRSNAVELYTRPTYEKEKKMSDVL